jgi:hypothetical protein
MRKARVFRTIICAAVPLALLAPLFLEAQYRAKQLDPDKAHTDYTFPVRPGGRPLRFKVVLDQTMTITAVSVFQLGESIPFQTLPMCQGLSEQLTEYDQGRELLEHADLNFDGFEDLMLLQYYQPHLATKVFCVYTWDNNSGQFRYAPEIPGPNPVPHPGSKTITVHQDWMGGVYADTTYRWTGSNFVETERSGRAFGSDRPQCGFTDHCEKLISGEMVTTLWRPIACAESTEPDPPLVCPAGATTAAPNAPKKLPAVQKK